MTLLIGINGTHQHRSNERQFYCVASACCGRSLTALTTLSAIFKRLLSPRWIMDYEVGVGIFMFPASLCRKYLWTTNLNYQSLYFHIVFFLISQSRIWNKFSLPDCKFTILFLSNFTKRELNFSKQFLNNIDFNSRLVKSLSEMIVNLRSGNVFQIRYTVKKFYNPGAGINIQYRIVNLLSFPLVISLNGS